MATIHMSLPLPLSCVQEGGYTWCLRRSTTLLISKQWDEITCKQCIRLYAEANAGSWHPLYFWAGIEDAPIVRSPGEAYRLLKPHAAALQENFFCVTLNGLMRVRNVHLVTVGLLDQVQIHPREVFVRAIQDRAKSIIIAHNRPSGSWSPSLEDIALTKRFVEAGLLLDIPVADHIIFTPTGYCSIREEGYLSVLE